VSAKARGDTDLELWDVEREAAWFRKAMGRRVEVVVRGR